MKKLLGFLILVLSFFKATSQGIPQWNEFKDPSGFFMLKYPSKWVVNQEESTVFIFSKQLTDIKGRFYLKNLSDQNTDSAFIANYFNRIKLQNPDAKITVSSEKQTLSYRQNIKRDGQDIARFYWVIQFKNILFETYYEVPDILIRDQDKSVKEEMMWVMELLDSIKYL